MSDFYCLLRPANLLVTCVSVRIAFDMAERAGQGEEKSNWKSRLFRVGIVSSIVAVVTSSALFLGIGVSAFGGSWLLGRKEKK